MAATIPVIEKHGIDLVLQPFVRDLKILAREGLSVSVNGERTFREGLLLCLGDN